jgi:uncharacterized protein YceH (UPF0502 family)
MPPTLAPLSLVETRVLGVLVEKQRAVPDTYPLSLNALVAGCNQKTSRDPILEVTEREVQATIDALRPSSLVVESSGGRVMRYAHNLERVLDVPGPAVVLLAVLMLRGPQTAGELRINADRLHRFADISAVEGFLHELAARPAGALVVELARASGARETRWMHLLSGPPAASMTLAAAAPIAAAAAPNVQDLDALARRVDALEAEVESLRAALAAAVSERSS